MWTRRIGIAILVLLALSLLVMNGNRTRDLEERVSKVENAPIPDPYDDEEIQGRVDDLNRDLNDLRSLVLDSSVPTDELRSQTQTAVVSITEEFRYMCGQFTAIYCRSYPNRNGLFGR